MAYNASMLITISGTIALLMSNGCALNATGPLLHFQKTQERPFTVKEMGNLS